MFNPSILAQAAAGCYIGNMSKHEALGSVSGRMHAAPERGNAVRGEASSASKAAPQRAVSKGGSITQRQADRAVRLYLSKTDKT
jgi:hypothetical protein